MVKTLTKININLIDNEVLLDTILDHLKIFNINIKGNLHKYYSDKFGASYLPWRKFIKIEFPKDTLNFIKIAKDEESMNKIFEIISNTINFNWIDLATEQQLLVFSIFALFHEIGHIQWSKKLYKRYAKMYNKEITEKKFINRFYKHGENCEKFKIKHRDKFEEKFCDKFASLMLGEFIAKEIIKIF